MNLSWLVYCEQDTDQCHFWNRYRCF